MELIKTSKGLYVELNNSDEDRLVSIKNDKMQEVGVFSSQDFEEITKKIRVDSISTSIGKQIIIYLVSFFLPPFGLGWAIKYLKSNKNKAKIIGAVSLILTVISIFLTIIIFQSFMNQYAKILNSISNGTYR